MLAVALLVGSGLFAFLAIDAWRLRSRHQLPSSILAKLRGYPHKVHTPQDIARSNLVEGQLGSGSNNFAFVAFAVVSVTFLIAALILA
jgi:hypothetical protein